MDIIHNGKFHRLKGPLLAGEVLKKLGVPRESVIIVRRKMVMPETEKIKDSDRIELIRVFSGG